MDGKRALTGAWTLVATYVTALRPLQLAWGATGAEVDAALPGDALLDDADVVATRAIGIRASATEVWPWIAQLGQGRGGFYSYDRLENLVGCEIVSAEQIVPAWQHPEVGDEFRLHPEIRLEVAVVEPGRALVVRSPSTPDAEAGAPYDFTWAFVLQEGRRGRTRLVVRERYRQRRWWAPAVVEPLALVSFVMTQRMLRGIRDRAERETVPPAFVPAGGPASAWVQ
jgi:hypothetical protein